MKTNQKDPTVLVVTPEVSFLPDRSGGPSETMSARAGGLGDVSATLIHALYGLGVDVHLAMPDYRKIFRANAVHRPTAEDGPATTELPAERIHLVKDRSFFHLSRLSVDKGWEAIKTSLLFQREVINRIVPMLQPDLIHCHDWMTGLIPSMSREYGIPCLFTLYNVDTVKLPLSVIEDHGIDAADFWQRCYFERFPVCYEETRESNPVDLLTSAVFASHFVNALSPSFLGQILTPGCDFMEPALRQELQHKQAAGCLAAIEHAPPPHFNPAVDDALYRRFGPENHSSAKPFNKLCLQERLGLRMDSRAPLLFWPTRLGRRRRGLQMTIDLLPRLLTDYADSGLQVIFIAGGDLHADIRELTTHIGAADRVAVADFNARIHRLAFAAADFVLMPLYYEPCGMSCKIGQRYGALPIGHDTGGIHDALSPLDVAAGRGNGFVFDAFHVDALRRTVAEALAFYALPDAVRAGQVGRIMAESLVRYDHEAMARAYVALYERMLQRPFGHLGPKRGDGAPHHIQEAA